MNVIYSGKCISCGYLADRVGKAISDGEHVPHSVEHFDHNGLTATFPCDGRFVSIMGRDEEQIDAAKLALKQGESK